MLVEPVTVDVADDVDGLDTRATRPSILTGFVRGQPLSPDHLVQIGEHGPFRIERLEDVSLPLPLSRNQQESMQLDQATDRCSSVYYPTHLQENSGQQIPAMQDVLLESSPGPLRLPSLQIQSKGVQLDDHHYFSDDSAPDVRRAVKAPQGTSAYQAAWYLDDESAEEYDDEGPEGAHRSLEAEPLEIEMDNDPELGSLTADDQSLTFEQLSMEDPQLSLEEEQAQLLSYRDSRKNTAAEDREYPDEIELPASAKAREQLAKYRGLKNLRSSAWDHTADQEYQPEQWDGLWSTRDVRGSLRMAAQTDQTNCVLPGRRVRIHLKDVPAATQEMLRSESALPLFTLLPGEHRQAACNIQINLSSDCPRPIKSKEELILQCGPRRLAIQPLFSEGGRTPNDVHKFKRFLHPGQTAVATFMGLFHHGPIPCLLFLRDPETSKLQLIGTGTNLPPSSERVIAKRIVLTGHPYKIHKRLVTIRYMFFNPEDVMWFKALQLWTRRGRIGYIKESLGTHGYFKATFDGKLNPLDTVAISLYKRVWPRVARAWSSEDAAGVGISEVMDANAMHD